MLSTQQISYILAVVDTGSFSRAAEQCFVTQPTLSMQIKKAEQWLGQQVFHRDNAGMEVTTFGAELLPLLRHIQADLGSISRLKDQYSGRYTERIRMGIIPTVAAYLLQDCFSEWQALIPGTQLLVEELKTEELLDALERRKIDMAILAGPAESPNWRNIPLFTEEIWAYTPGFKGKQIPVSALEQLQPWLLSKGNCLRTQMMQFCSISEEPVTWNYAGGNMDILMRMVDSNGGYTLVPANYRSTFPRATPDFKQIVDTNGSSPARNIIAISAHRHANWESMEKLIRSMQLKYGGKLRKELEVLNWK